MIVTDIFGNRVNAEIFKLEVIEGAEGDERGKPVLILSGYHHYLEKDGHNNWYSKNRFSMLARCICTDLNATKMLERKNKLEQTCREISEMMHKELDGIRMDSTLTVAALESQWMVQHGYRFYEKDEVTYEDRLYCIEMSEGEELQP